MSKKSFDRVSEEMRRLFPTGSVVYDMVTDNLLVFVDNDHGFCISNRALSDFTLEKIIELARLAPLRPKAELMRRYMNTKFD